MPRKGRPFYPVVLECGLCGNLTYFDERTAYKDPQNEEHVHRLLECPACNGFTYAECWDEIDGDGNILQEDSTVDIHYPKTSVVLTNLPQDIEEEYINAKNTRRISKDASAIHIRRALEAICACERVTGRNLVEKLKRLGESRDKGREIPQQLVDIAQILRLIGNSGAHYEENRRVSDDDLETALDFLEAILEYLYVAPAKVSALQEKLKKKES